MTIVGHELHRSTSAFTQALEVLVSGTPDPFWDDVRRHVTSWLIISGIAGIGYLAVSVPIRLDKVLANQDSLQIEMRSAQRELAELEHRTEALERGVKR